MPENQREVINSNLMFLNYYHYQQIFEDPLMFPKSVNFVIITAEIDLVVQRQIDFIVQEKQKGLNE